MDSLKPIPSTSDKTWKELRAASSSSFYASKKMEVYWRELPLPVAEAEKLVWKGDRTAASGDGNGALQGDLSRSPALCVHLRS